MTAAITLLNRVFFSGMFTMERSIQLCIHYKDTLHLNMQWHCWHLQWHYNININDINSLLLWTPLFVQIYNGTWISFTKCPQNGNQCEFIPRGSKPIICIWSSSFAHYTERIALGFRMSNCCETAAANHPCWLPGSILNCQFIATNK